MESFVARAFSHLVEPAQLALFADGLRWQLDHDGLAVVEDFIDPNELARFRKSVEELTPRCYPNGKYNPLIGSDLDGTPFGEISKSAFVRDVSNAILRPWKIAIRTEDIYPAMNILVGQAGQTPLNYHFDPGFLTMAIPIVMPEETDAALSGRFRIWPNVRAFSQSALKDRLYWQLMKREGPRNRLHSFTISFKPGSIYFFYGFRSYHGTDPLDPSHLRANCLMNIGGPLFQRDRGEKRSYRLPSRPALLSRGFGAPA